MNEPMNIDVRNAKWPRLYSCRFIEPGLVNYEEYGNVLVKKEVLDKMAASFVGKPVINEVHKDATPENFDEVADGTVTNVYYGQDGWYWADFIVWDPATQKNCESKAYSVSCAYNVSNTKSGKGEHNNISYDHEVVDGEYTHLAIVPNPRYEEARIVVYNSKGGTSMFKFWKKDKKDESKSLDLANSIVKIDDKSVGLADLVNSFKKSKASAPVELANDSIVEIEGEEISVAELVKIHTATLKNAADDEDEEKKKKEKDARENAEKEEKEKKEKEEKDMENCGHCGSKTMKNKLQEHENVKVCENCKTEAAKGVEHFNKLKNATEQRGEAQPIVVKSMAQKAAEGRKLYGSAK